MDIRHHHPFPKDDMLQVLRVDASGRHAGSVSRTLTGELIDALRRAYGGIRITTRDLALEPVPFVDEAWIDANFTAPEARSAAQRAVLAHSDALVQELAQSDVVVIGVPVYNFGIPAALKAWVDMVARARLTFRYTENGPEGLLRGKRAYLVAASGGVAVGSDADFATGYLRHVLGFLGITDVEVMAADRLMARGDEAMVSARARIDEQIAPRPASRVGGIA